jgi:hypothetical protein
LPEALETTKRVVALFLSKFSVTKHGVSYCSAPLADSFYEILARAAARAAATKDFIDENTMSKLQSDMMNMYKDGDDRIILAAICTLIFVEFYNNSTKDCDIIRNMEEFLRGLGYKVTKKAAAAAGGGGARAPAAPAAGGAGGGGARAPAAPAAPAPAAPAPAAPCTVCGKAAEFACEKCREQGRVTPYCSVECQRVDWQRGHRFVHNPPPMENVSRKRKGNSRNSRNRKNSRNSRNRRHTRKRT